MFTRERDEFVQFYKDLDATGSDLPRARRKPMPLSASAIVTGPINFRSGAALAQEIDTFLCRHRGRGERGTLNSRSSGVIVAGLERSLHLQREH